MKFAKIFNKILVVERCIKASFRDRGELKDQLKLFETRNLWKNSLKQKSIFRKIYDMSDINAPRLYRQFRRS